MRFFQHVYGRVSKGVQGSLPGYQLAAVSDGIAGNTDLINRLNRFSFLDTGRGKGTEVRYSFFRFKDSFVAFGASRYARDQGGSIGAFAHNLVLRRESFLDGDFSPVDVLTSFPFMKNESDLPNTRLPEIDVVSTKRAISEKWKPLAFSLIDSIMDKTASVVPMVVFSEEDMWDFLALVFHMLPKLEASRLCFSSLFINAIDFIDGFKIVFIPNKESVPAGTSIIKVIDPAENVRPMKPGVLRSLWEGHWDLGDSFLRMVNVLRHHPDGKAEILPMLSPLISIGPDFRRSVEQLEVPAFNDVLFLNAEWIVQYWRAGTGFVYQDVARMAWKDPVVYVKPILAALGELGAEDMTANILSDLILKLSNNALPMTVLDAVEAAGAMDRFLKILSVGDANISMVCKIASRLRAKDGMDLRAHGKAVVYVLELIQSSRRRNLEGLLPWLSEEAELAVPRSFFRAVADCTAWVLDPKKHSWKAGRYEISPEEYGGLLYALWTPVKRNALGVSGGDWVSIAYHPGFPEVFLKSLARHFNDLDFHFQKEALGGIITLIDPFQLVDRYALLFIENSEKPERLARYYLELLRSKEIKARDTIERLEGMADSRKWLW